jgi:hypothetical protein
MEGKFCKTLRSAGALLITAEKEGIYDLSAEVIYGRTAKPESAHIIPVLSLDVYDDITQEGSSWPLSARSVFNTAASSQDRPATVGSAFVFCGGV